MVCFLAFALEPAVLNSWKAGKSDLVFSGDANIDLSRSSQSIKIGTDLSIDKSIKIVKSDLIDIDYIDQSVEIDDTLVSFIDLSRFLPISSICTER